MTSTRQASIRPIEPLHGWEHLYDCRNPTLRWILYGFDENYEKTLLALRKHWSNSIRDFYRDKLSLNTRNTPLRVAWRLDDNGDFIRTIEEEYPELDFAELVALRRYLKEAKRVDRYFWELYRRVTFPPPRRAAGWWGLLGLVRLEESPVERLEVGSGHVHFPLKIAPGRLVVRVERVGLSLGFRFRGLVCHGQLLCAGGLRW